MPVASVHLEASRASWGTFAGLPWARRCGGGDSRNDAIAGEGHRRSACCPESCPSDLYVQAPGTSGTWIWPRSRFLGTWKAADLAQGSPQITSLALFSHLSLGHHKEQVALGTEGKMSVGRALPAGSEQGC